MIAIRLREVDIRKKFHMWAGDLAKALKLMEMKSKAIRCYLDIDEDPDCRDRFDQPEGSTVRAGL